MALGCWIALLAVLFLGGCSQRLADEALLRAETAFGEQSFEVAQNMLQLASTESTDREVALLHQQSLYLLEMESYRQRGEVDRMLLSWTEINLIPARGDLIRDQAVALIREMIAEACARTVETNGSQLEVDRARHLHRRLGGFDLFEQDFESIRDL